MGSFYNHVADPNGVKLACRSKAALHDRLTQWIRQQQQSLLEAKCAKQHAPVRVVFHLTFHTEIFGEIKEEFLIEAGKVAPLQRKKK